MTTSFTFDGLTPLKYGLVMCDPPWDFSNWSKAGEKKNAKAHYECSPVDTLAQMPVSHLAAHDCLMWMWATNPMLPQAIELMRRWGFRFKTAGVWHKKTKHGKTAFGTGYILRSASEPFLIGTIGKPKTSRSVRSVIEGEVREHSRKPEEAYEAAEKLVPDVFRCDLFSRQRRENWDCWGDEIDMFKERDSD